MKVTLKTLKVALSVLILAAFTSSLMMAKMEYSKKEGVACTACHVKMGSKELNDVGKCYAKSKSLKDCKESGKK